MSHSPVTRPSLLLRIRDPRDNAAWGQFVEIYAPLVHAYARSRGVQDADAADLTQEVLGAVAGHIGQFEYQPSRGTFRGWLFQVTINKLRRLAARRKTQPAGTGDSHVQAILAAVPDDAGDEDDWNWQHAWRLFLWAAERARVDFREKTWQAFWRTAVGQQPAAEVAAALGTSAGAVHIARCRVLARVKELLADVEL